MELVKAFDYSVLVFEDEYGMWLKSPEFDLQILTEDLEIGLDLLEEQIDYAVKTRKENGEEFPEQFERTVKEVGKEEYGPTLLDLEQEADFDPLED